MLEFFKRNILNKEIEIEFTSDDWVVGKIRTKVNSLEIKDIQSGVFKMLIINDNISLYIKNYIIDGAFLIVTSHNNSTFDILLNKEDDEWKEIEDKKQIIKSKEKADKIKIIANCPPYDVGKDISRFVDEVYEIKNFDESGNGVYVDLLYDGNEYLIFNDEFVYIYG